MTADEAAAAARGRGGRGGPGGPPPGAGPGPGGRGFTEPPPPPVPTESVDDVMADYVQALGGQPALQNAKSRVMSGTLTTRDLVASGLTVSETSTGAYRIDIATQPPTIRASDGTSAWALGGGRGGGGGGAPGCSRSRRASSCSRDFGSPTFRCRSW